MASTHNKYGLSRNIPEDLKRQIRQKCGFGCVICGLGIIQYEHVDPVFSQAKEHDPSKMTLLCPRCHNKVTTGIYSKDKVKAAMLRPKSLEQNYSNELLDLGDEMPIIYFASSDFYNCNYPITVGGFPIMEIKPPLEKGQPFLLSAIFFDSKGSLSLLIKENEWLASTDNWDVSLKGKTLTIKEGVGKIVLQIIAKPPNGLVISKLNMSVAGIKIICNKDELKIIPPVGPTWVFAEMGIRDGGINI